MRITLFMSVDSTVTFTNIVPRTRNDFLRCKSVRKQGRKNYLGLIHETRAELILCKSFVNPFWRKLWIHENVRIFKMLVGTKIKVHLLPTTCKWCVKRSVFFWQTDDTEFWLRCQVLIVSLFALFKIFYFICSLSSCSSLSPFTQP